MSNLDRDVESLGPGEKSKVNKIIDDLVDFEADMLPHLKHEEDGCLPLMRAYFTKADLEPKIKEIIEKDPPVRFLLFDLIVNPLLR